MQRKIIWKGGEERDEEEERRREEGGGREDKRRELNGRRKRERGGGIKDHHHHAKRRTATATETEVPTRQEDGVSWVCDTDDTFSSKVLLLITVLFLLPLVPLLLPFPIMVLGFVFNAIDLL